MERAWIRNEVAVSPVIATILMVAITVVLAAVLYVLVTSLIPDEPELGHVVMSKEPIGPDTWELSVTSTTTNEELSFYKVIILKNGTRVHTMDPLEEVSKGNYRFTDLDEGGKLTSGDRFYITCEPGSRYELNIFRRDSGNIRGSVDWET